HVAAARDARAVAFANGSRGTAAVAPSEDARMGVQSAGVREESRELPRLSRNDARRATQRAGDGNSVRDRGRAIDGNRRHAVVTYGHRHGTAARRCVTMFSPDVEGNAVAAERDGEGGVVGKA